MAKVVVGVDASPGALAALSWAADEARAERTEERVRRTVVVVPSGAAERKPVVPAV